MVSQSIWEDTYTEDTTSDHVCEILTTCIQPDGSVIEVIGLGGSPAPIDLNKFTNPLLLPDIRDPPLPTYRNYKDKPKKLFLVPDGASKDELQNAYKVLFTHLNNILSDELLYIIVKYSQAFANISRLEACMKQQQTTWALSYKLITDNECPAIVQLLTTNTVLTDMFLTGNLIGDRGATSIGDGLHANHWLKTLDLSMNNIGGVGAMAIANALTNNSKLKKLYLRGNPISYEAKDSFNMIIDENKCINQNEIWQEFIL